MRREKEKERGQGGRRDGTAKVDYHELKTLTLSPKSEVLVEKDGLISSPTPGTLHTAKDKSQ